MILTQNATPVVNWNGVAALEDGTPIIIGRWKTQNGTVIEITAIDEYGVWGRGKNQMFESRLYWDHQGHFKGSGPGCLYDIAQKFNFDEV